MIFPIFTPILHSWNKPFFFLVMMYCYAGGPQDHLQVGGCTWRTQHRVVLISSVTQSCPTLCDPMNCSTPGLPVYHQLPESTQTHVHQVSDAIQPSHPLLSPSPPAFSLSQHWSFLISLLFTSGGQSIRASASASVLPMNTQDWLPIWRDLYLCHLLN